MPHTSTEHTGEQGRLSTATPLDHSIDLTHRSNRIAVIALIAARVTAGTVGHGLTHLDRIVLVGAGL